MSRLPIDLLAEVAEVSSGQDRWGCGAVLVAGGGAPGGDVAVACDLPAGLVLEGVGALAEALAVVGGGLPPCW